jgi:dTDP-4-amino-4,6-dideoxygalactose transaminase
LSIPLIDLKAQYKSIKDEVLAAINSVLDSGEYILGRNVAALESAVAELCGVKHGIGVASGTDALLLSLSALGIGPVTRSLQLPTPFFLQPRLFQRLGLPRYLLILIR